MESVKDTKSSWIDVHNADLMIKLGIQCPYAEPRDSSVWTKTSYDKKSLQIAKSKNKEKMRSSVVPRKTTPIYSKLIICLKPNNRFEHTTYSIVCGLHQIGDYLQYFSDNDKQKNTYSVVDKYYYNGKTYSPTERPFWY